MVVVPLHPRYTRCLVFISISSGRDKAVVAAGGGKFWLAAAGSDFGLESFPGKTEADGTATLAGGTGAAGCSVV